MGKETVLSNQDKPDILIWRFDTAPPELAALSTNGGDEDWIAIIRKELYDSMYIPFLESENPGGIGRYVQKIEQGSFYVFIGSHG